MARYAVNPEAALSGELQHGETMLRVSAKLRPFRL